MNRFDEIYEYWSKSLKKAEEVYSWSRRVKQGEVSIAEYCGLLQEIFHHAFYNPQAQAFATSYFAGKPRGAIKKFFIHAASEVGHDLLALNDLKALGVPNEKVIASEPLPSTTALTAIPFFLIQFRSAVSYLGYLFHLEFLTTALGEAYIKGLTKSGVPKDALTFVYDHATIDVSHNKLMFDYVNELVLTEQDFEDVCFAIRVTMDTHFRMIDEGMKNGTKVFRTGATRYENKSQTTDI